MYYRFLVFILLLIFPVFFVSADNKGIDFQIFVNDYFTNGDEIDFEYIGESSLDNVKYIPQIKCQEKMPLKFPKELTFLKDQNGLKQSYESFIVSDEMSTQSCRAIIEVISPVSLKFSKNFKINTKPVISPELLFCVDVNCREKYNYIKNGENVFIKIKSDIDTVFNLEIKNKENDLDIIKTPSWYSFENSGKYNIKVTSPNKAFRIIDSSFSVDVKKNNKEKIQKNSLSWVKVNSKTLVFSSILILLLIIIIFLYKQKQLSKNQ